MEFLTASYFSLSFELATSFVVLCIDFLFLFIILIVSADARKYLIKHCIKRAA